MSGEKSKKNLSFVSGTTLMVGEMKGDSIEVSIKRNERWGNNSTVGASPEPPPLITHCPSLTLTESMHSFDSSGSSPSESQNGTFSLSGTFEMIEESEYATKSPIAGSSTTMIEQLTAKGPDTAIDKIEWRRIPGERLQVRSKNYLQSRIKAPSPGELYECIHVDFIESSSRIPNVSGRLHIPTIHDDEEQVDHEHAWYAPEVFVVSLVLPAAPTMLKEDGPSLTITMTYKMKATTRSLLEHMYSDETSIAEVEDHPHYSAVRLFDQWCLCAKDDPAFMGRFKLITSIDNLEELGLPTWISRWNGKPVLIKRSGTTGFVHEHQNCMEMEISLHPFPWATKKAVQYLMSSLSMLLNFGFVIEGRDESELPEVVIGLCQLCYPLPQQAVSSKDFFNELGK